MTPRRCWIPACSRRSGPASSGAAALRPIGTKPEPPVSVGDVADYRVQIVTAGVCNGMNLATQVGRSSVKAPSSTRRSRRCPICRSKCHPTTPTRRAGWPGVPTLRPQSVLYGSGAELGKPVRDHQVCRAQIVHGRMSETQQSGIDAAAHDVEDVLHARLTARGQAPGRRDRASPPARGP